MFADKIAYTDFDGNDQVEEVRLNLTKNECRELDLKYEEEGGLFAHLKGLIRKRADGETAIKPMFDFLKEIIEMAYGKKSADGRRFVKFDRDGNRLSYEFMDSACFDALMDKILSEDMDIEQFILAIFPKTALSDDERQAAIDKTKKEFGIEG